MSEPKLILLYGFAGIGKTTIAKRYVNEHSLAMNLDQDRIIEMLGLWSEHETQARKLVAELSQTLARAYLDLKHDIIVPCLPTKIDHIDDFEKIAKEAGAKFLEIALTTDRDDAIKRLLKRGKWGEEGSPHLTHADLPTIENLYDKMSQGLKKRPNAIHIPSIENNPSDTYQQFLTVVNI